MLNYLSMVLMAVLWAGAFVVGKLSVSSVAPEMVAFLRFLTASALLLPILALWQKQSLKLARRDWLLVAGLGATGIAAYNLLFFWGLRYSFASDGAMIIPTLNPLVTMFAAAFILGEPLTQRKLAGAGIALAGQVLIFGTLLQAVADDPARLLGDMIYLASALCWSAYSILGRLAARRFTPLASTTWASVSGTLMLLPFALWSLPRSSGYTPIFWLDVLYLGIGATVAGFFLWSRGLHLLGASRAAVFMNLVPVFTLVLAYLVLDERPGALQVVGMLVVLGGVYVSGTVPPPAQTAISGETA